MKMLRALGIIGRGSGAEIFVFDLNLSSLNGLRRQQRESESLPTAIMTELFSGILLILACTAIPFLGCLFRKPAGMKWVPINDGFKYSSDDNIYAAMVSCVRQRRGGFAWPVDGCADYGNFETLRVASYRLAALLGAWLPPRPMHALALIIAPACHYALAHLIMWQACGSSAAAAVGSVLHLYYSRAWLDGHSLPRALKIIVNRRKNNTFDTLGSHHRYVILSIASLYGLGSAALVQTALISGGMAWHVAAGAALMLLPFAYPGTMVSFGLFAALLYLIHSIQHGLAFLPLLAAGVLPLAAWFSVNGAWKRLFQAFRSPPPLMAEIHLPGPSKPASLRKRLKNQFRKRSSLLVFLSFALSVIIGRAVEINTACLGVMVVLGLLGTHPRLGKAVERMQDRGANTLYSVVLLITVINFGIQFNPPPQTWWFAGFILITLPLIGAERMSKAHALNGSFLMSADRLDAYNHLRRVATPDSTVCCLDVADMQMQMVYGAGLAFIGGAEWLQPPDIAMRRYFQTLTRCGISHSVVREWITSYFKDKPRYGLFPAVAKGEEGSMEGVLFLNHMLYLPYVKTFAGEALLDDSCGWNPAFLARLDALSQETSTLVVDDAMPDFILVSGRMQTRRTSLAAPESYIEEIRCATWVLYRRQDSL